MLDKVKKILAKLPFWGESSRYITNSVLHETTMVPMKLEHMCVIVLPVKFSRIYLLLDGDLWVFSIELSFLV